MTRSTQQPEQRPDHEDRRPRDRKRTHQAKALTQARKAQRRSKRGA